MAGELLALAALAWVAGGALALARRFPGTARALLAAGALAGIGAALAILPAGAPPVVLPLSLAGERFGFAMPPEALWLLGFGLAPAFCVLALAPPESSGRAGWLFGVALSLLGALGLFGMRDGAGMLIAWETMSLGGAAMILSEWPGGPAAGNGVLFMLALLEAGAVALLLAVLVLSAHAHGLDFAALAQAGAGLPALSAFGVGVLLLLGFGTKLGLAPFYEWFPGVYGAGSGASGVILSGVVLNAAYFALARTLADWLAWPGSGGLGMVVVAAGVASAVLAALYAFQQEDWRMLLGLSSAENAATAVACLGAALLFRASALPALAGLAWSVALLLLAAHPLAKGALFVVADGVRRATGSYRIRQAPILRQGGFAFGIGALFAVMSLSAMPPQPGFVAEWFVFQTVFQGFHLPGVGGRLVLALGGAGLALTAAVAFATFIKLFGLGLLGAARPLAAPLGTGVKAAVGVLGTLLLALAIGMPLWLAALGPGVAARFGVDAPGLMHAGPLLVPLSAGFAFISPSLLAMAMPLLALLPLGALWLARRRMAVRRVPVWFGGSAPDPARTATTALTFANALRTFYGFVYRPAAAMERDTALRAYFITRVRFRHHVAPLFGPWLFAPMVRLVHWFSARLRLLQSGRLEVYLGLIGLLFVLILGLVAVGL